MIKSGDATADSRTLVMVSKIGMAVPPGYSQQTSGLLFVTVLERRRMADAIKAKAIVSY